MDSCFHGEDRWKIVCGSFSGVGRSAVELLYAGISCEVPYVLITECAENVGNLAQYSLILVGTRKNNCLLEQIVGETEIPEPGFLVRVMKSPFAENRQVAIVAGSDEAYTIYAAAHFTGSYLPFARQNEVPPEHMPYFRPLFSGPMKVYEVKKKPAFQRRGFWTWGHCIYDMWLFAQNMARLGMNELIVWNDYAPLNLSEFVECFHRYGIQVIFGYTFAWGENVDISSREQLEYWKNRMVSVYESQYEKASGDGIYFQSFTETKEQEMDGLEIASTVTKWVNEMCRAMLERWPELRIQFGLHATSVTDHLEAISKVDPRVEIIWEDCGAFPYSYNSRQNQGEEKMLSLTKQIAKLREGAPYGVVLKSQMCLDWTRFEHQKGPFLIGCSERYARKLKLDSVRAHWHDVQSYWIKNIGQYQRTLKCLGQASVYALVEDSMFEEGCFYPVALYAQMLWNPEECIEDVLQEVAQRSDVVLI